MYNITSSRTNGTQHSSYEFLFPLVRGEIFGTRVSCEARSAELSRYKFVCRWRYPGGTGEDQCGAQGRAFEVKVCLSVAMSRGTGEEQLGAQGRAFEVQVCLSVAMSGGTGEEQCGAQGRAFEVQVCLSVAVFARFLCERRAKVAGNFVTFIKFRQNDERKRRKSL